MILHGASAQVTDDCAERRRLFGCLARVVTDPSTSCMVTGCSRPRTIQFKFTFNHVRASVAVVDPQIPKILGENPKQWERWSAVSVQRI